MNGPNEAMAQAAVGTTCRATVTITNPTGLHARPMTRFVRLAKTFAAAIRLKVGERSEWVDAKSPVKVSRLKAKHGETLYFEARGTDSEAALGALVDFVERDFDEQNGE
ncbi:MAG: HPr family phosphocarrier protein [Kiloniellales bacterium]